MLRIGTRGSPLARWQADWVRARLHDAGVESKLILIRTQGDLEQTGSIESLGSQGVFTKEIQRALLDNEIDLAVHSLKDLPTEPVEGLILAAVPRRGPQADAFISEDFQSLEELPEGGCVGTGSLRRRTQLLHARPDLRLLDLRGNVHTRLSKLHAGDYDAIILAEAGLTRLGLSTAIKQRIPNEVMVPAVGQGALGIETRADDQETRQQLESLNDAPTHAAVLAERSMLATLRGGCLAPIGGAASLGEEGGLHLLGVVLSGDGTKRLRAEGDESHDNAVKLGKQVADSLLADGAAELIDATRQEPSE